MSEKVLSHKYFSSYNSGTPFRSVSVLVLYAVLIMYSYIIEQKIN